SFDGWMVGRADDQDMAIRAATGGLEMVYRTAKKSSSNGRVDSDGIFMGLMHMYSPPPGFGFDVLNGDPPLQDDPLLEDLNIADRLQIFRQICLAQGEAYNPEKEGKDKSKNIILTMGMDFNYQQATSWYQNLDKLIHYSKLVAEEQRAQGTDEGVILNVFYSNPRIYMQSRHAQYDGGIGLPEKDSDEDFFPYGDGHVDVIDVKKRTVNATDGGHAYWTGYFTSRPNFKGMVRGVSRTYTAARQLTATAKHRPHEEQQKSLEEMTDAIGLAQHHDAITGTEKQHVDDDYSKRLHSAQERVMESIVLPETFSRFGLPGRGGYCPLLNESICAWTTNLSTTSPSSVLIAVYNALSHPSTSLVSLPIPTQGREAESPEADGTFISQLLRRSLLDTPSGRCRRGKFRVERAASKQAVESWVVEHEHHGDAPAATLQFTAEDVPPMGASIYRITPEASSAPCGHSRKPESGGGWRPSPSSGSIGNEHYRLSYKGADKEGQYTFALENLKADIRVMFNLSLGYYESSTGRGPLVYGRYGQASGAYIFRPNCPEQPDVRSIKACRPKLVDIPIMLIMGGDKNKDTLRMEIGSPAPDDQTGPSPLIGNLTIQIPPKEPAVLITWSVAIDVSDGTGKEAVLLLETDVANDDGNFYTDSNGRDWVHRKVNYRKGWQLEVTDPVAMNYYPINSGLRIMDQPGSACKARQLTLVPDRAHGGASLLPGQLELMVHRRCLVDDWRGVDEALNETDCSTGICLPKMVTGETHLLLDPVRTEGRGEVYDSYRELAHQVRLPLLPVFARDDPKHQPRADSWSSLPVSSRRGLPREVQVLTLELLTHENTPKLYYDKACAHHRCMLLRLANTYAQEEGSTAVELDLAGRGALLEGFELGRGFEVTLNAGRDLETAEKERLKWSSVGGGETEVLSHAERCEVDWRGITLEPLQIRTFIVSLVL
ncbi:hypothetical protein FOZ62_027517, partial [Perkinsus olseni]